MLHIRPAMGVIETVRRGKKETNTARGAWVGYEMRVSLVFVGGFS